MDKLGRLESILKNMDSVLIAFSGGVDSTFLLKAASMALSKDKILAVTANSPTYPKEELEFSKQIAKSLGVRHKIIKTEELSNKNFISNPLNRCYFCKKELFSRLKKIASASRFKAVIDASNVSDKHDFRPGSLAKKELGIRSPLIEAGLTKTEIRVLSKKLRLPTWNKPALACLASRLPYGKRISIKALSKIAKAENYLRSLGFEQVRVRHYGGLCRIEVEKNEIPKLVKKRKQIVDRFKKLGYNYVTVDLEGYRTGSMNEDLPRKPNAGLGF